MHSSLILYWLRCSRPANNTLILKVLLSYSKMVQVLMMYFAASKYVCVCVCMYICVYVCIYVCMYTYIWGGEVETDPLMKT